MIKLLVVDDEADVCDFVKKFFEDRNYTVYVAHDGEEALRSVKNRKPNIVLLDIRMKRMDGIETLKRIKELDKEVVVIMVTAVEDKDKMEEALSLGAKDYITKPLVLEDLERTVIERSKIFNDKN